MTKREANSHRNASANLFNMLQLGVSNYYLVSLSFAYFFTVVELAADTPFAYLAQSRFPQQLRHIARASSSPILPNAVLTISQLSMAELGFEPMTLRSDNQSCFEQHFWLLKFAQLLTDLTDPQQLSVRSMRTPRQSARAHTNLSSLSHSQISASPQHEITAPAKKTRLSFACLRDLKG